MPVSRIAEGMSDSEGRPSVELHSIIGLILIRELHGWTGTAGLSSSCRAA